MRHQSANEKPDGCLGKGFPPGALKCLQLSNRLFQRVVHRCLLSARSIQGDAVSGSRRLRRFFSLTRKLLQCRAYLFLSPTLLVTPTAPSEHTQRFNGPRIPHLSQACCRFSTYPNTLIFQANDQRLYSASVPQLSQAFCCRASYH